MHTTSPCTRVLCTRGCLVLTLALSLGLSFASHAQNSAVNFTSSQPFSVGLLPQSSVPGNQSPPGAACDSLFPGKFRPGSKVDFLATCLPVNDLNDNPFNTVFLNQGNGLFSSSDDSAADNAGEIVSLVADLNGDGFDDLVLLNTVDTGRPGLGVQLSNGNGTFKAPVFYGTISPGLRTGVDDASVAADDFEDNGRLDIAVLSGGSLVIFHNNGSGAFTQVASYPLNSTPSGTRILLVAGDLNGDHRVDLAVVYATSHGTVVPYISQGNGKFTKGSTRSAGDSPMAAAWGDFNNDGFGDIAVTTPTGFNIIFGSSSGNFTGSKFTYYPTPVPSYGFGGIAAADFDKDGKLDLAVDTIYGVEMFWGSGNGTFSTISTYSSGDPGTLAAVDMNNDGKLDLVTSSGANGSILYNLGGRGFRAAPNTHSPYANGIVAGDFNRDGKQDVAVVNTPTCAAPCNGMVSILLGEGTYFNAGPTYTIGMHGSAIAAGDLNGDGIPDLVVVNAIPGDNADVSILLGTASGTFGSARNLKLGSLSNDAFLADVNGDGKLDLIEDGGVALGDGKGSFGNLAPFPDGIGFTSNTYLAVADFNGDRHPDIAATWQPSGNSPQAEVLINNGKGDFSGTPLDAIDDGNFAFVTGVAAGPLSGTINDIVFFGEVFVGSGGNGAIQILQNDGKGNFTPGPANGLGTAGLPHSVVIADFNHDGNNDIGFTGDNSFFVATGPSFNSAGGPFNATIIPDFAAPFNSSYTAVADFNKDGWPDVVFTSPYGVSRLYNVPVPAVSPGTLKFTGSGSQKVTIKNTTTTSQAIAAVFGNGSSSTTGFTISSNTCKTLAVGASCTVTVSYNGASGVGATLYITANAQFIDNIGISAP